MNIFKRATQVAVKTITAKEIQADVSSLQEAILKEAKEILSSIEVDKEKADRMEKMMALGFKSFDQVAEYTQTKKRIENAELVGYYAQHYPYNKFITHEIVERVCKKYNLLYTNVDRYIDDIPIKNQNEIINFRVKYSDLEMNIYGRSYYDSEASFLNDIRHYEKEKNKMVSGHYLKIVAPESKLNTQGMKKVGISLVIEDPIVLQPVNGGYLIVTAWGDEASDESIVNERHN